VKIEITKRNVIGVVIIVAILCAFGIYLYRWGKESGTDDADARFNRAVLLTEANRLCRANRLSEEECEKLRQSAIKKAEALNSK
jgi:hypothetical protein